MVRINNELIQTAIGTGNYNDSLKKWGQVRPTCSEKCGKWIRAYPKKKKKLEKKEKEEEDKPEPMEFSDFTFFYSIFLNIFGHWENRFQKFSIKKCRRNN